MTNSHQNSGCQPAGFIRNNEQFSTGSFITIEFGGYFNCRQTTDPDPTDDPYGTSGYTMALTGEPMLDQIIRMQWEEGKSDLRPSGVLDLEKRVKAGVQVKQVNLNGDYDETLSNQFMGATVTLMPDMLNDASGEPAMMSPMFISNNNVVGSDDTMAFVIEPFNLEISQQPDGGPAIQIHAVDVLSTSNPTKSAIEFDMPAEYARRLSYKLQVQSPVAHQAIGVFDEYGYFRARRQWLTKQIEVMQSIIEILNNFYKFLRGESEEYEKLKWALAELNSEEILPLLKKFKGGKITLPEESVWLAKNNLLENLIKDIRLFLAQEIQNCKTRLFQLETWGDRVINKLGFQTFWKHDINCIREFKVGDSQANKAQMEELLGGEIISDQPWQADYWFGGWDGDLLIGYMAGTLQIPFKPTTK